MEHTIQYLCVLLEPNINKVTLNHQHIHLKIIDLYLGYQLIIEGYSGAAGDSMTDTLVGINSLIIETWYFDNYINFIFNGILVWKEIIYVDTFQFIKSLKVIFALYAIKKKKNIP